ncbi:hypothetical protein [Acinetobacter rathckeae]|uniref:hypothetical protein n=1 Tax=Acinetobacter rathckeae TaxID=2605272 RepID=UPI0018A3380C|nr:hypothetical protein [Acinetobacter rathckeae]MBF7688935.1 hypothetical protein [Acinetobacter rathckeae]MBF7696334.1 hypothetical protein [Acinetobacter rathckeae]
MWDSVFVVSVFDHWLSEAEAEQCKYMSYGLSVEQHVLQQYLVGEAKFLDFYLPLFDESCEKENKKVNFHEYKVAIINSLREQKMMNICLSNGKLKLQGGFDRTDYLFVEKSLIPEIIKKLEISQLHILEVISDQDYLKEQ